MTSKEIFYQTLSAVPQGHYTSYGTLAKLCGVHVRQIQAWLRTLPKDSSLPWFRIMNGQRKIAEHHGAIAQHNLLAKEGVLPNKNGKYPIEFFWQGE